MLLLLMNLGFAGGGGVIPPVIDTVFDGGWANYPEAREAFRRAREARKPKKLLETPDELELDAVEEAAPQRNTKLDAIIKRGAELAKVSSFIKELGDASDRAIAQARESQARIKAAESLARKSNAENTALGEQLDKALREVIKSNAESSVKSELEFMDKMLAAKSALENYLGSYSIGPSFLEAMQGSAGNLIEAELKQMELTARLNELLDPDGSKFQDMLEQDDEEALLLL